MKVISNYYTNMDYQIAMSEDDEAHNICYWCESQITDSDKNTILPDGRGTVHEKCGDEWYGMKMSED